MEQSSCYLTAKAELKVINRLPVAQQHRHSASAIKKKASNPAPAIVRSSLCKYSGWWIKRKQDIKCCKVRGYHKPVNGIQFKTGALCKCQLSEQDEKTIVCIILYLFLTFPLKCEFLSINCSIYNKIENIILSILKRLHSKCHSKHSMMIHSLVNTIASNLICAVIMGCEMGGRVCCWTALITLLFPFRLCVPLLSLRPTGCWPNILTAPNGFTSADLSPWHQSLRLGRKRVLSTH